jgi:hypothetical protein
MSRRNREHSRTKRSPLKPRNLQAATTKSSILASASSAAVASRALVGGPPLQRDPLAPSNSQSVAPPDAPTTASSGSSVTPINAEAPNAASPEDKPHSALPGKDALPESSSAIHEPVEQSTKATVAKREPQKKVVGIVQVWSVPIDDVRVPTERTPCNPNTIALLARGSSGLPSKPITVIDTPNGPFLVGGQHWFDVAKAQGRTVVECIYTIADENDARMADIQELIYLAGPTVLEMSSLVMEWLAIWERGHISGQDVQEFKVGRPHGGISQAARVLCVPGKTEEARRKSIERAMKIAGISSEAKDEAKRLGLDNNQSALFAIANVTPEEQVAKAQERAARKRGRRHKQTITPDHVKGVMLDAPEPQDLVIGESDVDGPGLPPIGSPPTIPKEHGADPHGDAFAQQSVNAPDDAAFDALVAAWAAASEAVRHRFVIEIVQPDTESSFGV